MKPLSPRISILGRDPTRTHRINANSFQQNALITSNGWQYAAFYTDNKKHGEQDGKCLVNLARRNIQEEQKFKHQSSEWSMLTFDDYEQSTDDGHNTISIGLCEGDGTIHVAFDHHCNEWEIFLRLEACQLTSNRLKFRISHQGITHDPPRSQWNVSMFGKTQDFLPGLVKSDNMKEVTYPRFVVIEKDLLLTYRIGQWVITCWLFISNMYQNINNMCLQSRCRIRHLVSLFVYHASIHLPWSTPYWNLQ